MDRERIEAAIEVAYAMDGMGERHRAVIALRWCGLDGDGATLADVAVLLEELLQEIHLLRLGLSLADNSVMEWVDAEDAPGPLDNW